MINFDSFRAYDIRGVYPTDLDEEAFYRIAKAYTHLFHPKIMVVGMDARESGPQLKQALDVAIEDLQNSGFIDQLLDKYEPSPNTFYRVAQPYRVVPAAAR